MSSKKVTMKEAIQIQLKAMKLLFRVFPYKIIYSSISLVLQAIVPYVTLYLSALIIDELVTSKDKEQILTLIVLTLVASALLTLLAAVFKRLSQVYNTSAIAYMSIWSLYAMKTLEMDFCVVDDQATIDLHSQVKQNANSAGFGLFLSESIHEDLISSFTQMMASLVLTFSLFTSQVSKTAGSLVILNNPIFIVLVVLVLVLVTLIPVYLMDKMLSFTAGAFRTINFGNRLVGYFMLYRYKGDASSLDTRSYSQEELVEQNYKNKENPFLFNSPLSKVFNGKISNVEALRGMVTSFFLGLVYVFVCLKAYGGAFGIGALTQYVGALVLLSSSLSAGISAFSRMKSNYEFQKDSFDYLDMPNKMYQGSLTTEKRSDKQYEVEFKNVSFKYPGSEEYILHQVSMKFTIGNKIAIVGENGSGKTTFIKLLCRLYDPSEGEILLNGINIKKYKYEDYISTFAVVFQDFKLLSYTLGENVAASSMYDRARATQCLIDAGFGKKLSKLKNGLDTYVYHDLSNEGVEVSGGEAQKIALARALYRDSGFIILDEPTAALDPIAEAEVYESFNTIVANKTAVYISHRLSSCKFCDEILVFSKGVIVEQGTHERLLLNNKKYTELWNAQAQYYNNKKQS